MNPTALKVSFGYSAAKAATQISAAVQVQNSDSTGSSAHPKLEICPPGMAFFIYFLFFKSSTLSYSLGTALLEVKRHWWVGYGK